jgi:iron(III) transport system ATP-binding protein
MLLEIRMIQKRLGATILYITHDQQSALQLCDKMAIMQPDGSLCQFGSDEDIILTPANRFVFEFIGVSNFIPVVSDGGKYALDCGEKLSLPENLIPAGENIAGKELGVRLNDVVFDNASPLRAKVTSRVFLGSEYNYFLKLGSKEIRVQQDMLAARLHGTPEEGEETGITFINPHFYDPKPPEKIVSADEGKKKKKFSLFGKGA